MLDRIREAFAVERQEAFVKKHTVEGARVYSDEASGYVGLENHKAVSHGRGHYVDGDAHTNGIESFGRRSSAPTKARSTSGARSTSIGM